MKAQSLVLFKEYSNLLIYDNNYSEGEYKFFEYHTVKQGDINTLREYISDIEDYNIPLRSYHEHFEVKFINYEKCKEKLNQTDKCKEEIHIAYLELEGIILILKYKTDKEEYVYELSIKKPVIEKTYEYFGPYCYESMGELKDFKPVGMNKKLLEEMYLVAREYAREHNLFYTKLND